MHSQFPCTLPGRPGHFKARFPVMANMRNDHMNEISWKIMDKSRQSKCYSLCFKKLDVCCRWQPLKIVVTRCHTRLGLVRIT